MVGTGGAFFTGLGTSRVAGSEVSQNDTFGVLKVTLHAASYDWRFEPIAGSGWTDSGYAVPWPGRCAVAPPTPPAGPPAGDRVAPVLTGFRVKPRMFRRRTVFRFGLSEAAKVRIGIVRRRAHGRNRGWKDQRGGRSGRKQAAVLLQGRWAAPAPGEVPRQGGGT